MQCFRIIRNEEGSVYGLNLDIGMIHYAFSKYPHIPFLCADAVSVPIKDSRKIDRQDVEMAHTGVVVARFI
ncbi:MAG: hypothetical protein JSV17_13335 [Candidatus Aminicenantes bacterium]|nr:MAG: hypothetical protein JSV17_13335 [Candidatus Aminicenantes bacterium]